MSIALRKQYRNIRTVDASHGDEFSVHENEAVLIKRGASSCRSSLELTFECDFRQDLGPGSLGDVENDFYEGLTSPGVRLCPVSTRRIG